MERIAPFLSSAGQLCHTYQFFISFTLYILVTLLHHTICKVFDTLIHIIHWIKNLPFQFACVRTVCHWSRSVCQAAAQPTATVPSCNTWLACCGCVGVTHVHARPGCSRSSLRQLSRYVRVCLLCFFNYEFFSLELFLFCCVRVYFSGDVLRI